MTLVNYDAWLERPYADLKEDWGDVDDCQLCEWQEEVDEDEGVVYHHLMVVNNRCEIHGDPDELRAELEEERQLAQWEYEREGW